MKKFVKCGMVGGSMNAFIGEVHRKAIAFDPRASLVAGSFSTKPEGNQAVMDAYQLDSDRVYSDYKAMAAAESAREDGIDFVTISTPNFLHYDIAKVFLEAGINVVCEKPLCFTLEQSEELKMLANAKKLLFAVTYTYTGYTMVKVMKEMIAEGKIGKILTIHAEYVQDWLLGELSESSTAKSDISSWRTDPEVAGISNCVGDIGTHVENIVHYVTGMKIKKLLAVTNSFGQALDMNANIILEYENGVNGSYWCSQIAAGKQNGLTVGIYGDKGSLEWEQHYPDYIRYTPVGEPTQTLSRGCGYISEKSGSYSRLPTGHPEGLFVAFANIYKNYISALIKKENGESQTEEDLDFPSVQDGINGVKFVHAVVESNKKGSAWVEV